ncbi:MAG: hypothetical protein K2R93_21095 [Gemmatimonadaceae bacterium]|nr:hypothetical protein [Gemmatimonadaceae bacterium]
MTTKTAPSTRAALATATLAILAACGDGTAPNASGQVGVGFQLATNSLSAAALSASAGVSTTTGVTVNATDAGLTIERGTDKIVVTKAQLVVRDVKLKTAVATCVDDDDSSSDVAASKSSSGSSSDKSSKSSSDDDDDCPTIRVGPFLVDMPVSGADAGRVSVAVPEGTYSKVRLTIHKVTSSDSADLAFQKANPDFRDISVRLVGTYNGTPFTFVNDVEAKLNVPLTAPLSIKAGGDNVTVTLDLAPWFVNPAGGLYNPADANVSGSVRAKVQNAIRSAFRAFRDKNRDGKED